MAKNGHIKNGSMPAMPFTHNPDYQWNYEGLTKREYFAGLAMQVILANPNSSSHISQKASSAVSAADALLEELEK